MKRGREILVIILCLLAELGLAFQLKQPQHFASSAIIIVGTKDTLWIIARILIFMNMLGLALFALSVWRGNRKGKLHIAYFIMLLQSAAMFILPMITGYVNYIMDNEDAKFNMGIHMITMIFAVLVFAMFILREKGGIRVIPKMSTLMLLVILGQFVTNCIFPNAIKTEPFVNMMLYGIISVMPYIAIFVFEFFVLEPTMRRYR